MRYPGKGLPSASDPHHRAGSPYDLRPVLGDHYVRERKRAEREAAVRQVEATAEEMEALRAEVTTLREQVAAAGSRRRGIFGS